jgi:biopolymer transport protein ExbB
VLTYAADEAAATEGAGDPTAGHQSHFGIIIQSVFGTREAIVEQLVIGLCGVMMAIAILVMYVKAIGLSRARRATNRFMRAYAALGANANDDVLESLIDGEEPFGDSPLFNIYTQGIREVRTRLSPSVGALAAGLERKSLEAIRATLDAVMVRETQKLNGMLVLLTMAISGGPFIGLLGTVVGVMVTFAAIAATGDVNIAAIAPGMAAALLATVAGLGVAIPSLFGYNYLSSKAKEINADMHVFADEFVARMNERYGI